MKNKFFFSLIVLVIINLNFYKVLANEQFNFDITELQISENGNIIKGFDRGSITSNNGIIITSNIFEYNKINNVVEAIGNVIVEDKINDIIIYSENIKYDKNNENIYSKKKTKIDIYSRFELNSKEIGFDRNKKILYSKKKINIKDPIEKIFYELTEFIFELDTKILKGKNIFIKTNYNLPQNDKYFFSDGIFNLYNKNFLAKNFELFIKKDIFGNLDNDPRLKAVSAKKKSEITTLKKGIFTSCKIADNDCPPWIIEADTITHDKNKKTLAYENAIVKLYDFPVFYFPYFYHPDPSVKRQSGFLQPELNNSSILGSSIGLPYFYAISPNKDMTMKPVIFEKEMQSIQTEYREKNLESELILDFGYVNNYKSSITNEKNSLKHFFGKYNLDLDFDHFDISKFNIQIQQSSNDTYLRIFDSNLSRNKSTPSNFNILHSKAELELANNKVDFISGFEAFENLQESNNDKYQFIMPYYNLRTSILDDFNNGFFNFNSSFSNELINTNNLKTKLTNDLNFESLNFFI